MNELLFVLQAGPSLWDGLLPIFLEWLLPVVGTLISLLVGWVLVQLQKRLGLDIEQKHRDALQTALTNAAALLIRRLADQQRKDLPPLEGVKGSVVDLPSITDPVMNEPVEYVRRSAPDAVHFFRRLLDERQLAEKVLAKASRQVLLGR